MEILSRSRKVADLHVLVCAELEEALKPRTGVFGSLPLIPVREEHDKGTWPKPLGLPGSDKLVDDNLCAVCKVTKLSLPDAEHFGVVHRVSVIEPEHSSLDCCRHKNWLAREKDV